MDTIKPTNKIVRVQILPLCKYWQIANSFPECFHLTENRVKWLVTNTNRYTMPKLKELSVDCIKGATTAGKVIGIEEFSLKGLNPYQNNLLRVKKMSNNLRTRLIPNYERPFLQSLYNITVIKPTTGRDKKIYIYCRKGEVETIEFAAFERSMEVHFISGAVSTTKEIFVGYRHDLIRNSAILRYYNSECPFYRNLIHDLCSTKSLGIKDVKISHEEGFMTSHARFLSREEAAVLYNSYTGDSVKSLYSDKIVDIPSYSIPQMYKGSFKR